MKDKEQDFSDILIMSDLDGTFLGRGSRVVDRNIDAIEDFKAHGGFFSFSTGRVLPVMRSVFPDFDKTINSPAIMCNGACIYDPATNSFPSETTIDAKRMLPGLKKIEHDFPDLKTRIYTPGYVYNDTPPISSLDCEYFHKICYLGEPERIIEVREELQGLFGDYLNYVLSANNFLELFSRDVTKGKMLSFVREYHKKRGHDVKICCIGDYENDIEMLRAADYSFCPSNAIDEVKKVSDYVVCSCDEGALADLIDIIKTKIKS